MRSQNRRGFSLIELLIVVTIILIIAAIAIPNLMRSKMTANEAAAVESLRTLNSTVVMYSLTYGGFPHAIADLGPSTGNPIPTSASADLIDSVMASGVKSGSTAMLSRGGRSTANLAASLKSSMCEF